MDTTASPRKDGKVYSCDGNDYNRNSKTTVSTYNQKVWEQGALSFCRLDAASISSNEETCDSQGRVTKPIKLFLLTFLILHQAFRPLVHSSSSPSPASHPAPNSPHMQPNLDHGKISLYFKCMGVLCTQAASLKDEQGALGLLVRRGQIAKCCSGYSQVVECYGHFWVLRTVVAFFYP
eukprot:139464-Amphidinium_carterae.1